MAKVEAPEAQRTETGTLRRLGRPRDPCPLCQRAVELTFHHLIPKKVHRRPRFRKRFTRAELARGIFVCRACHDGIHSRYDEMTLATRYQSLQALHEDEALQRHFRWVARQRVAPPREA